MQFTLCIKAFRQILQSNQYGQQQSGLGVLRQQSAQGHRFGDKVQQHGQQQRQAEAGARQVFFQQEKGHAAKAQRQQLLPQRDETGAFRNQYQGDSGEQGAGAKRQ